MAGNWIKQLTISNHLPLPGCTYVLLVAVSTLAFHRAIFRDDFRTTASVNDQHSQDEEARKKQQQGWRDEHEDRRELDHGELAECHNQGRGVKRPQHCKAAEREPRGMPEADEQQKSCHDQEHGTPECDRMGDTDGRPPKSTSSW